MCGNILICDEGIDKEMVKTNGACWLILIYDDTSPNDIMHDGDSIDFPISHIAMPNLQNITHTWNSGIYLFIKLFYFW